MNKLARIKIIILLGVLIILGAIFRFYNLNWGAPWYFHPDERNIASAVTQLTFPSQMNPHFFAYGTVPIYAIYVTGVMQNLFSSWHVTFEQAILVMRFYSALLSLLLIPSLFYIGKKMKDTSVGITSALLGTFSIGFIQFAHFGTFEIWLTFFSLWFFYFSLRILQTKNYFFVIFTSILFGLLMGIKVSSLPLILLPTVAIFIQAFRVNKTHIKKILICLLKLLIFLIISTTIYSLTNPFVIIDPISFLGSMRYESSVTLGTLPVFYTGEFFATIPIVFQFLRIYPFLLNPVLTLLFIPTFFYILIQGIIKKKISYLFLILGYLLIFLSQAFLFTKWTRYMTPTIPFMIFITTLSIENLLKKSIKILTISILAIVGFIFSLAYCLTVFYPTDMRVTASIWASQHVPLNAPILSEVYDLGIVPFNQYFPHITLFNFYDLDNGNATTSQLNNAISSSQYLILPSQRILKTRLFNPSAFPNGSVFYTKLVTGTNGFTKIYETPCDIWCHITYLGNPVFSFEETANVFDRPTVMIFKKMQ